MENFYGGLYIKLVSGNRYSWQSIQGRYIANVEYIWPPIKIMKITTSNFNKSIKSENKSDSFEQQQEKVG